MTSKFVFVLFTVLQIIDGALTYYGVTYTSLGMRYEATPHIVLLMQSIGVSLALFFCKICFYCLWSHILICDRKKETGTSSWFSHAYHDFFTISMGLIFLMHIVVLSMTV